MKGLSLPETWSQKSGFEKNYRKPGYFNPYEEKQKRDRYKLEELTALKESMFMPSSEIPQNGVGYILQSAFP
jgi:hypothetical protein